MFSLPSQPSVLISHPQMSDRKAAVQLTIVSPDEVATLTVKIFSFQKMMEAKIMREMEDTKETLQRSKKLLSGR